MTKHNESLSHLADHIILNFLRLFIRVDQLQGRHGKYFRGVLTTILAGFSVSLNMNFMLVKHKNEYIF